MTLARRAALVAVGLWFLEAFGLPPYLQAAEPVSGTATWYATGPGAGQAAAGPALRRAIGPAWRGSTVQVCAGHCVTVKLTDWCACPDGRVVDLSDEDFASLAPLPMGVLRVTVSAGPLATPPSTDTAPSWAGVRPGWLAQ
jgi:hypothetical protein